VEKRGRALGMIAPTEVAERPIKHRGTLLAGVAVSLGSMAAEELVFGETSNGMGGDGPAATALARRMVQTNMMGGVFQSYRAGLSGGEFDERVEAVLVEGYELAKETLRCFFMALSLRAR